MPVRLTLPSFGVLRVELLAGLVVALALIPEAISFSLIAGVDPRVGLFASFTMAVTIATEMTPSTRFPSERFMGFSLSGSVGFRFNTRKPPAANAQLERESHRP